MTTVPDQVEETRGMTAGFVFAGQDLVGMFSLTDSCRTGAAEAILELKNMGIKTVMLTGDSHGAASYIQAQLGNVIDNIHAGLLPEDKVRIVEELKSREGNTVMVGDGMNDAPALTTANVGISMGISGSAVAMETSHVTLMSNDVHNIPKAIKLAKKTTWKIIENIFLSISTKVAILALAFTGHPLLWAAVLADVGTCLLVITNSMLLLRSFRTKKTQNQDHHHHHHHHPAKPQHHHSEEGSCCKPQHSAPPEILDCTGDCSKEEIHVEKCRHDHEHRISIGKTEDHHDHDHHHTHAHDHEHENHHGHAVGGCPSPSQSPFHSTILKEIVTK